ncbi:MAG: hypothetical protein K0U74_06225 [Alphaproteobacteria bacterium]|nr:hypothetical protein [Alphaproteobacteria bacterium]
MRVVLASIAIAAAVAAAPYSASANPSRGSEGLAGIHKLHIENGRLCMADHDHYGQTGAWPTLRKAKQVAVKSWAGFTRLEYGDRWADFRIAAAKNFDCSPVATNRGEAWSCNVKARPCKR